MKTPLKTLIAIAFTAVAATVSTGASAASTTALHEPHRAQLLNVQFRGDSQVRGVHRAHRHHGFRGQRGFERHGHFNGQHRHHRGFGRRDGRGFNR